jgi:hypothetical protein
VASLHTRLLVTAHAESSMSSQAVAWQLIPTIPSSAHVVTSRWLSRTQPMAPNMTISEQKSKSKVCSDRRSVSQSVLVSSTHLGLTTRLLLLSGSCGFVEVGRPIWREDGSVIYNFDWPSPAQWNLMPVNSRGLTLVILVYNLGRAVQKTLFLSYIKVNKNKVIIIIISLTQI